MVLFSEGDPNFPGMVLVREPHRYRVLRHPKFAYCNVLEDGAIREGVKTYSSWPTIPQLYVDGNLSAVLTSCRRCMRRANCNQYSRPDSIVGVFDWFWHKAIDA